MKFTLFFRNFKNFRRSYCQKVFYHERKLSQSGIARRTYRARISSAKKVWIIIPPPAIDNQATHKSLRKLLKDSVLENFGLKPNNANMWIEIFESECRRLEIQEDRSWEAIRLFLENSFVDLVPEFL